MPGHMLKHVPDRHVLDRYVHDRHVLDRHVPEHVHARHVLGHVLGLKHLASIFLMIKLFLFWFIQ